MRRWTPDVDVFESDDKLTIRADLPGVGSDDLAIEVRDDAVVIQGEWRRRMARTPRHPQGFVRVVALPQGARTEEAHSTFERGILQITMPVPASRAHHWRRCDAQSFRTDAAPLSPRTPSLRWIAAGCLQPVV